MNEYTFHINMTLYENYKALMPDEIVNIIDDNLRDLNILEKHKNKMKRIHKDLIEECNCVREDSILREYLILSDTYDEAYSVCQNEGIDPYYDNNTFNSLHRLVEYHKEHVMDIKNLKVRYDKTRVGDMINGVFLNLDEYYDVYYNSYSY